ncbi:MAG: ubiquinol-cytochrome c reductase iron-sulfur subunit [Xanthomonadales bacterium]|nr:ubiquinol-cytochrome c reductase iron-sulfur subunit [Gammaproteobacteria bacterium]MBT8049827.1 ubiquinol-cytochrome c reductase iron-sulfur subunit [Gammaproteobacteria bacterium]MBT8056711.1 ubiquinol-cytochrome c reductase iron-sulfur subunit [Gammaproteobacteria bacterium]NNL05062.1 ubiquinol-cytochrome c reductase iron-sulfur subunit [Xanthomonadales bacterium]
MAMQEKKTSRRTFLNALWVGVGALSLAEIGFLISRFLKPREQRFAENTADAVIAAGSVDAFDPGSVTAFVRGKFYLARLDNGGFLALSRTCTHLGCTVPWVDDEKRFVCPCHASAFSINGEVLAPPAPRALDLFDIRIENGQVLVDTGKRTKRVGFEAAQAVYPGRA